MTADLDRNPGVDTAAAMEFMGQILARLDRGDLKEMARALEAKSSWVAGLLGPLGSHPRGEGLSEEQVYALLRSFFPSRRKARAMVEVVGEVRLGQAMASLVHGEDDLASRVGEFQQCLFDFPEVSVDLPWELLHLYDPSAYWLSNRWMWNPKTETGALRLVVADQVDLYDPDIVGGYVKVGQALAVVQETIRALGLVEESPFAVDVFLACVYGIYMYTVLRMRMSQEFNRIVPELPSLARRLLGVNDRLWEETKCP